MSNLVQKLKCPWNSLGELAFVHSTQAVLNLTGCSHPRCLGQMQGGLQGSIRSPPFPSRFMQNWKCHSPGVSVFGKPLADGFYFQRYTEHFLLSFMIIWQVIMKPSLFSASLGPLCSYLSLLSLTLINSDIFILQTLWSKLAHNPLT